MHLQSPLLMLPMCQKRIDETKAGLYFQYFGASGQVVLQRRSQGLFPGSPSQGKGPGNEVGCLGIYSGFCGSISISAPPTSKPTQLWMACVSMARLPTTIKFCRFPSLITLSYKKFSSLRTTPAIVDPTRLDFRPFVESGQRLSGNRA